MKKIICLLAFAVGCAGTSAVTRASDHQNLSLEEAQAIVTGLDAKAQVRCGHLEKALDETSGVSNALTRLGDEHITEGIKEAKDVIAANPNDYLGYRVAADFYRLTEDWANFDIAVKKLEELN